MKKILLILFAVLLAVFAYCAHEVYGPSLQSRYQKRYLENLYENSQWRIPNSIRVIGDSDLYKVAGLNLVNGGRMFDINPEVPPLGKTIIGLAIKTTDRPNIANHILYAMCLIVFYKLLRFRCSSFKSFLGLVIFGSQNILLEQLGVTMLELPQLLALLMHLYFALCLMREDRSRSLNLIGMGLSLGLYTSVKFGFFAIALLGADWYAIKYKFSGRMKYCSAGIILGVAGLFFVTNYWRFMVFEEGFLQLIRNFKWMVMYYRTTLTPNFFMVVITTISGMYKGWFEGVGYEYINSFSIVWTITFVAYIALGVKRLRGATLKPESTYVVIAIAILFLVNSFILFFARYLINIIPLLVLICFFEYGREFRNLLLLAIVSVAYACITIYPSANPAIDVFARNVENKLYREVYMSFVDSPKGQVEFEHYNKKMFDFDTLTSLNKRSVVCKKPKFFHRYAKSVDVTCRITSHFASGDYEYQPKIRFVRVGHEWKIVSSTVEFVPNQSEIQTIENDVTYGRQGSLISARGLRLTYPEVRPQLFLTRSRIADRKRVYGQISQYCNQKDFEVNWAQNTIAPYDRPIALYKVIDKYTYGDITNLRLDPALSVGKIEVEVSHPAVSKYGQTKQLEELKSKYESALMARSGGALKVTYKDNRHITLVDREPADGKDIVVSEDEIYIPE